MRSYDQPQVDEVYTIKQVAERTGVPANTIRSWERRLGFLSPGRTEGNYRRYAEADIATIIALRDARNRGLTIEQALREVAKTQDEVPATDAAPLRREVQLGSVRQTVGALLAWDEATAARLVSDVSISIGIDRTCASLCYPTCVEISRREASGEASAAAATFARSWMRRKLVQAFAESLPESGRDLILIATVLDDFWRDALLALAIVTSRSGYRVAWFGEPLSSQAIREACRALRPAVVVLASNSGHFPDFLAGLLDDAAEDATAIAAMGKQGIEIDGITRVSEDALETIHIIDSLVRANHTKPHLVMPQ
jgi:MerR family transcriptional regulator, light-induced transcriptional regulator